jgi:hypothetical protein
MDRLAGPDWQLAWLSLAVCATRSVCLLTYSRFRLPSPPLTPPLPLHAAGPFAEPEVSGLWSVQRQAEAEAAIALAVVGTRIDVTCL